MGLVALSVRLGVNRLFTHTQPNIEIPPDPAPQIKLSRETVRTYHDKGYVVLRSALPAATVHAVGAVIDSVFEHPNALVRRTNVTAFCGFSLHNHMLNPLWRQLAYSLPLAAVAGQLMETNDVVYSQDILHATTPQCTNNGVPHSDANQGPFSIERRRHWGDNMVVAWIAVDPLEHVTMELWPGTHQIQNATAFDGTEHCAVDRRLRAAARAGTAHNERVVLEPGDVALFQGLTMHRVTKRGERCTLRTCRRATIRYVDGAVTRWRTDVPPSRWPFIERFRLAPGAAITEAGLASVWTGEDRPPQLRAFADPHAVVLPSTWLWLRFAWRALMRGISPSDVIFRCPGI